MEDIQKKESLLEENTEHSDNVNAAYKNIKGTDYKGTASKEETRDIILKTLLKLKKEYKNKVKELTKAVADEKKACYAKDESLFKEIVATNKAIKKLEKDIAENEETREKTYGTLVDSKNTLLDVEAFIKDLTHNCETRAVQWDQRSKYRLRELNALKSAHDKMFGEGDEVKREVARSDRGACSQAVDKEFCAEACAEPDTTDEDGGEYAEEGDEDMTSDFDFGGFFQVAQVKNSPEVFAQLLSEAHRLNSSLLLEVASHSEGAVDRVLKLINELIQRLNREENAEATKEMACKTLTEKLNNKRELSESKIMKMSTTHAAEGLHFNQKRQEILEATLIFNRDTAALKCARCQHNQSMTFLNCTILNTKDSLKDMGEVMEELKAEYAHQGRQETASTDISENAEIKEKTKQDGTFDGAYQGSAGFEKVLVMMEQLHEDWKFQLEDRKKEKKQTQDSFYETSNTLQVSIARQAEVRKLAREEAVETQKELVTLYELIETESKNLFSTNEEFLSNQEYCVDSGMTAKDQIAKRKAEIKALKAASAKLK